MQVHALEASRSKKRDAPAGHPVERRLLSLESLLGNGCELVEGLDVLVSHLSEDLAVELNAGELQTVHEPVSYTHLTLPTT